VRDAVGRGLTAARAGDVGRVRIAPDAPWLQLVGEGESADADADAVIAPWAGATGAAPAVARPGQLTGIAAPAAVLADAIPFALERGLDLLLLEGSGPVGSTWPELAGAPDLTAIRDAIRILRALNREEDVELLWFGGVRSGTDAAKLIGLGANAVVVGMSMGLAVGGRIEGRDLAFYGDATADERAEQAELFLSALRAEASIMPRCTGKTDIHNLEPEDLRSISVATATAAGIPLAGFNAQLAAQAG
jgi:hypothetical protein